MKRIFTSLMIITALLFAASYQLYSQQQSVVGLLLKSFNEAHQGFPSMVNDTLPFDGFVNKVKESRVKQYEGVKDIFLYFEKNFKSKLLNDSIVRRNQMKIIGSTIMLGQDKTWDDYKDTLSRYYNKIVNFYIQAFGKQLNYTSIIQLQDPKQANTLPRYSIYFYEKKIQLPEGLTNIYEVERQLDVVGWFCVELKENILIASNYNLIHRISGGQ